MKGCASICSTRRSDTCSKEYGEENVLEEDGTLRHRVYEADIRRNRIWSKFLEILNEKLNGLPPCPYAKQAWADDKVVFSINTGMDLDLSMRFVSFKTHNYDIVVWADEDVLDMEYLDGCVTV